MELESLAHPRPVPRDRSRQEMVEGEETPVDEDDQLLEAALDEALARLATGEALDLECHRRRLSASQWARFAGTARAEEYRWRVQQGGDAAVEPLLEGLDPDAREHFFRTLAYAQLARQVLPHRIEPGMEIRGRWVVLRPLGSGGQAKVYAAWDKEFDLEVALKVFDEPALGKPDAWALAALTESRVLARLRSRNIVRIFDVVREQGLIIVVMDLVRGICLRDALDRLRAEEEAGARPRERTERLRTAIGQKREGEHTDILDRRNWYRTVVRLALAMARTLEQAHANGIAHRDLNPKNIMLVGGGEPVLLDFGLAVRRGFEGPIGWTIPYVAPERIGAQGPGTEPQADVYQLGLVLYELLTLERAFALREGESSTAVLLRVACGDYRMPREACSDVPEALEAICLRALATRPEVRYSSAAELGRDLERWLRGLPPLAAPVRRAARLGMRVRYAATNPAVLGIVVLAAVAIVPPTLAGDEWIPPRVTPIQERLADLEDPSAIIEGEHLVPAGSVLGATVDCPAPAYLYAFELSGKGSIEQLHVFPAADCMVADLSSEAIEGAVRLEPGKHSLWCRQVSSAEEREGLLLVFSRRESPVLEGLRQELVARDERFEPATYGELPALIAGLTNTTKGQSISSLDEKIRRRLHELARKASQQPLQAALDDLWQAMEAHGFTVFPDSSQKDG